MMATSDSSAELHDQAWVHHFIRQMGRPPTAEERQGYVQTAPAAPWYQPRRLRLILARRLM